jgi:hypothetical protein
MNKRISLVFVAFILGGLPSFGQEDQGRFHLEVDPLPYLFGGSVGHFGWSLGSEVPWMLGFSLIHSVDLPQALTNANPSNAEADWAMRINRGLGIWGQFYPVGQPEGWFLGLQLFTQEIELSREGHTGTNRTNLGLAAAQVGYLWHWETEGQKAPAWYIRPWLGVGFQGILPASFEPGAVTSHMRLGDSAYQLDPWQFFGSIHLGHRF